MKFRRSKRFLGDDAGCSDSSADATHSRGGVIPNSGWRRKFSRLGGPTSEIRKNLPMLFI